MEFDWKTGEVKAIHVKHNLDKKGGVYELACQNTGYKNGFSVILGDESNNNIGEKHIEGLWNNYKFEIAGAETGTSNNIKKALNHCASKPDVKIAVVYFPNDNVSINDIKNDIKNAINRYEGLGKKNEKGYVRFFEMYFINSSNDIIYKKSH